MGPSTSIPRRWTASVLLSLGLTACGGHPLPEVPLEPDPEAALRAQYTAWHDGRLDLLLGHSTDDLQEHLESAIEAVARRLDPHTYNTAIALAQDLVQLWREQQDVLLGSNAVQQGLGVLGIRSADAGPMFDAWADLLDAWCQSDASTLAGLRGMGLGDVAHELGPELLGAIRRTAEPLADGGRLPGLVGDEIATLLELLAAGESPRIELREPPSDPNEDGTSKARLSCGGVAIEMWSNEIGRWVPGPLMVALYGAGDGMAKVSRRNHRHRRRNPMIASMLTLQLGYLRNAVARLRAIGDSAELDAMAQDIAGLAMSAFGGEGITGSFKERFRDSR